MPRQFAAAETRRLRIFGIQSRLSLRERTSFRGAKDDYAHHTRIFQPVVIPAAGW
jgi:hypothetical protein